ncbi:hypothetical protein BCON_0114g00270 [Botryotinia convoluta]|uniref:Uncharacterized protein n=1 Tax=Botryotinia convoluta TaxID=54673 RepID=A0A4Z1HZQ0_9HELO|nr:hypothetical protein BCON_0114g00270 [Botryotinia convoluta]
MEKFLMIFEPTGSKQASVDDFVQFWEEIKGKNDIYHIDEEEMKNKYGEMVEKWEAWYGMNWKKRYGELGHIWNSKDERSVSTPKRRFDDTPSKSRSIEKKSRSGKSSISGGNDFNMSNSPITGDTHPRSENRYTSMPTLFSPASRSENSPISGSLDSNVSSPSLASISRPNQGNAYTLIPPPLFPASPKFSRRLSATQQGNVGLSSGFSYPFRLTGRLVSESSESVEQSARDLTSETNHLESPSTSRQSARRIATSHPSSLGKSAKSPILSSNQLGSLPSFSLPQSNPSNLPDPLDIDTENQPAEQVRESGYDHGRWEFDDEYEEMLNNFDKEAFQDIIDSIFEKTGDELEALTKQAIAE